MLFVLLTQVYYESDDVLACIVTCGGLCPGLNTVIREIVCGLSHMYGVKKIIGIDVSPIGLAALLSKSLTQNLLILSSSCGFREVTEDSTRETQSIWT